MEDHTNNVALGGVIVSTSGERFAAMRAFYVEALDLVPRSDREGFVNFDLGSGRLTVALHSHVAEGNRDAARLLVNLVVDDLDRRFDHAAAHGAAIVRPPEAEHWGGRICTLADPDGNLIQLMTTDPRRPAPPATSD